MRCDIGLAFRPKHQLSGHNAADCKQSGQNTAAKRLSRSWLSFAATRQVAPVDPFDHAALYSTIVIVDLFRPPVDELI